MSRVWILSEKYFPEERSTGYLLTHIAEGLANQHDVGVITGPPTREVEPVGAPSVETCNGVRIHRTGGTHLDKDNLVGRGINWVTRTVPMMSKALREVGPGDLVIVVTNPPLLPYLALLVKWIKGAKIALLVHDVYPEVLTATGMVSEESTAVRLLHQASRFLYDSSRIGQEKWPSRNSASAIV